MAAFLELNKKVRLPYCICEKQLQIYNYSKKRFQSSQVNSQYFSHIVSAILYLRETNTKIPSFNHIPSYTQTKWNQIFVRDIGEYQLTKHQFGCKSLFNPANCFSHIENLKINNGFVISHSENPWNTSFEVNRPIIKFCQSYWIGHIEFVKTN